MIVRLKLMGFVLLALLLPLAAGEGVVTERGIQDLLGRLGPRARDAALLERGVRAMARLWSSAEGDEAAFVAFGEEAWMGDDPQADLAFSHVSDYLESLWGNTHQMSLDLQHHVQLETGPLLPIDIAFSSLAPGAHLMEDLYRSRLALQLALNFPAYTLEEKNRLGKTWTVRDWAKARLGDLFDARVPADLLQKTARISANSDLYISAYNIHTRCLRDEQGRNPFPVDKVLLSHWNLRDEIKAGYSEGREGLGRQKLLQTVMERIIRQEIPREVINCAALPWKPSSNKVLNGASWKTVPREEDRRYQMLLDNFHALRALDGYYPEHLNTAMKRKFDGEMEIPQKEVVALFEDFLGSPVMKDVARLISRRLGRRLQPFDIWYDGFKARSQIPEERLSIQTRRRYPDPAALKADLPHILKTLGFTPGKASFLAERIGVDPARGSGHASGGVMKGQKALLRTRIAAEGMDYKGFNIGIHEFGHNVEQTFSLYSVPEYLMNGVPNTAFTEALAFIFQQRDLRILGEGEGLTQARELQTLDVCWSTFEIMGVSLVDMGVWDWMYAHPEATAAELREAVLAIATAVWNRFFAPAYGVKDSPVLAVYSHMISYPLYLSAYAYGQLIQFQLEEHLAGKDFGSEVERIFSQGRMTPRIWMEQACGRDLEARPLLDAAARALKVLR